MSSYSEDLHSAALAYHRLPRPGKLEIQATKPLANQRDLALAYSPGVAAACTEIANNPVEAAQLKERMKIPVFHDDQHGTAIIVGAAIVNALMLNGKKLSEVKIVCSGAGAAAIACLNLLVSLGAQRKNIWVSDIDGVVHEGRNTPMDRWTAVYAQKPD